ncbi:hypothetical protein ABID42_002011 [Arcicella rosea]|uniref:toll/interleukin-1 receptor domain-containing protein n=1 Tax=Arcicella rosea TaxID=502909 RepID=UPI00345DD190
MTEEEIVRFEANGFFMNEMSIGESGNKVHNYRIAFFTPRIFKSHLENRLLDFFSQKSKSYFLDEINILLDSVYNESFLKNDEEGTYKICLETSKYYVQQFIDELPVLVTSKHQVNSENQRNSIFISYSHADKDYVTSFKRHFANLIRTHDLDLWDDSKIKPGQKWEEEIKKAMQKAKVAIFVTSADFFASDFIANKELPELLRAAEEEGAKVLSIIVKPCDFSNTPLGIYQAMNNPTHTLLHMNELQREELWVNLVSEVRKILEL